MTYVIDAICCLCAAAAVTIAAAILVDQHRHGRQP